MTGSPYENSMLHFDVRDEIKKLGIAVDNLQPPYLEPLVRLYVLERLAMILAGRPISLDVENAARFNRWKKGPERLQ